MGKYGHMRCEYLKENHRGYYISLLLTGELNQHLHEIEEECYEMTELLVKQMKGTQGVTEALKAENQMVWVGMVNNIKASAEEVVLKDVVYVWSGGCFQGSPFLL